jgi:Ca2+-binding RTX toxin-like protein
MTGGVGADTFVFNAGTDVIRDFEPGDDTIDLTAIAGLDDWSDVTGAAQQVGGKVVFTFAEGTLTLLDFSVSNLDQDDFMF